jgi:hypothetical protein
MMVELWTRESEMVDDNGDENDALDPSAYEKSGV